MLKFEKIFFWITLISFTLPLATMLDNGYRIYLFELPLWILYTLWAFRFGLRAERLRLVKFDFYFGSLLLWLILSMSYNNTWGEGADTWWFWTKCYLMGIYVRHNLYRLYSLSAIVTFFIVTLFFETSLGLIQSVTQSSIGAVQQYFGKQMDHSAIYDAGVLNLVRVQGTFKHSNILGNWIVILLPLVIARFFASQGRVRVFYKICISTSTIAIILTLSRGNWASVAFGFIMMSIFTNVLSFKHVKKKIAVFSGLILAISTMTMVITYQDELSLIAEALSRRVEILPGSRSSTTRYNLVLASSELIMNNPVLGVGLGKSNELLHFTEYDIRERFSSTVHNIFLIIATEGGLVALLLFILALWQPLKRMFLILRRKSTQHDIDEAIVAAGLFGGYSSLFFAMMWYTGMLDQSELPLILTLLNLGLAIGSKKQTQSDKELPQNGKAQSYSNGAIEKPAPPYSFKV